MVENPHAGKEMFFDRIVIDHRKKEIYLDDITRSPSTEHLIKTYGYASQLGKMFPGYRVMPPKDIVYSTMKTAVSGVVPTLRKAPGG